MKLTIITVCYNNRAGLERTLRSVAGQTCRDFQYVVIDGGSTDGGAQLLGNQPKGAIDYWVSEKDKGIYNAMNKGIAQAKGEYCLFLNSGDELAATDTLQLVLPLLGTADFMTGDTICLLGGGKTSQWNSPRHLSTFQMTIYSLSHQATFIRTAVLKARGYREDLRIVADWEQMFYELIIRDRSYQRIPLPVCKFEYGGVSSSKPELREAERKKVLDEHLSQRMQHDLAHPNLLVRISGLADEGSPYYRKLEWAVRLVRKIWG